MSAYRVLIFDWDGTLVDSTAQIVHAMHQTAKTLALPEHSSQLIRQGIGLNFESQMQRLYPTTDLSIQEVRSVFLQHHQAIAKSGTVFFDHALDLLATLQQQGYTLAIATGKSHMGLEAVLERYELKQYFAMWCCGDRYPSKPDPAMLHAILDALSLKPEDALMVGDSIYDMGAAEAAKVDALAVLTGVSTKEDLMHYKPIGCMASIDELPKYLV